ncbi:MAG: GNAT family N-acetyltransferase [Pseudomonadota bacterium]
MERLHSLQIRPATESDFAAVSELAGISARQTSQGVYTPSQIAGLAELAVIDKTLIADGTYFVIEVGGIIRASGGWSRWPSLTHYDNPGPSNGAPLDPATDSARIRHLYTHPEFGGRGLGRALLATAEAAARLAGFHSGEMIATPAGQRLYASAGWRPSGGVELQTRNGAILAAVRMKKSFRPRERAA